MDADSLIFDFIVNHNLRFTVRPGFVEGTIDAIFSSLEKPARAVGMTLEMDKLQRIKGVYIENILKMVEYKLGIKEVENE